MSKKIAIIDPVGVKAGMDYYDIGLLQGLSDLDVETYLFSNVTNDLKSIKNYNVFESFINDNWEKGWKLLKGYWKSFSFCKREKIDWVIIHVFSAQLIYFLFFILARLFGLKIITISHDVNSLADDDNSRFKKLIYKYLSNHIIVHNQYSLLQLKKIIGQKNNFSIIQQGGYPHLIDNTITRNIAKDKLGFSYSKRYILFFGQIKSAKRLDVLIEAMQFIDKDVELIIAGRPWKDDFSKYDKQIKTLKLENKIHKFIRFITDEEREYFMKACDIMVLPYEEVYQSAALLMAMSYGLAIIASDIPSFKEVIRHNDNGILFESLNSKDLSDKLNQLLEEEGRLQKLKEASIQSINTEFSWSVIAKEYKKTFNL